MIHENLKNESILNCATELNKRENIPKYCYRRNSIFYPLICYANNITGLLISNNLQDIPVFIMRAFKEIKILKDKGQDEKYFEICVDYLVEISKYLITHAEMDETNKDLIPTEIQKMIGMSL